MSKHFKNPLGIDPIRGRSHEISELLRQSTRAEAISQGWCDEWDQALQTGEIWAKHEARRTANIRAGKTK